MKVGERESALINSLCSFVPDVQATGSLRILHVRAVKEGVLVSAGCHNKNTTEPHQPGETTHFNAMLPGKLYKGRSDHGRVLLMLMKLTKIMLEREPPQESRPLVSWDDHVASS